MLALELVAAADRAEVEGLALLLGMFAETELPAYFVSRSVGYAVLGIEGYDSANCPGGANPALPAAGTAGKAITLSSQFDGWCYVHLIDAQTLEDVDQFAIPEALDPAFAEGSAIRPWPHTG